MCEGLVLSTGRADHLILFRRYVSRNSAVKGRAVLEGVGLHTATIDACFSDYPRGEEEAVQVGLIKWAGGQGTQPPTWSVLMDAMVYARIAQQHIEDLKRELCLLGMLLIYYYAVCVCVCACMRACVCMCLCLFCACHMATDCYWH